METALEQIRKAYPKLGPTDGALVASALVLAGRHATAVYEGEHYHWPEDYAKLTDAMAKMIDIVQDGIDSTTKKTKTAVEEEPVVVSLGLMPNLGAGEKQLEGFDNLKVILSDALQEGVEFVYAPSDIMWQWALDRANWSTVAGREVSRRVKIKASFTEGAVGIELGAGGPKRKRAPSKASAAAAAEPEAEGDEAGE